VPWQMIVAYRRYTEQLDNMQGMLTSASQIPPLKTSRTAWPASLRPWCW